MKRFDLLRSPLLVLAVGTLLLNDFVLKAAFHNWFTGKLSDVAGLAAFTIFCCAIWPRHVWTVGSGISALFIFWKSPCSTGVIEAANAILPFAVGRTIDYSDLLALPTVGLVCATAHRMPLVEIGKLWVWLTAGVCLFAFTATSTIEQSYRLSRVAEIPLVDQAGTEAALQAMLDRIALRHGLRCVRCGPLSDGRLYESGGPLIISAAFDGRQGRLLFDVGASNSTKDVVDKTRPEVESVRVEIETALRERFPTVFFDDWRWASGTAIFVKVTLPDQDAFDQAFALVGDVLRRAGLEVERSRDGALVADSADRVVKSSRQSVPGVTVVALVCRIDHGLSISSHSHSPDHAAVQQRIVGDLERELGRAFGQQNVSVGPAESGSANCR